MKNEQDVKVKVEYGEKDLKQILTELLKEQYINYIEGNDKNK